MVHINVQEMRYCAFHPQGLGRSTLVNVANSVFSLSIIRL